MGHNRVAIREFIAESFSDQELNTFCQTHFQELVLDFGLHMGRRDKAELLVGYCARRGFLDSLLKMLEAARPERYRKQKEQLKDSIPSTVSTSPDFERWLLEDSDQYNLAALRELVLDAFMLGELERFCRDRQAFRPVLTHFGQKYSQEEVVDVLLEYCRTRVLFPDLLAEIHKSNPKQYERHYERL